MASVAAVSMGDGLVKSVLLAVRHRGPVVSVAATGAFLIYLRTLAPGVLPGDSGEFQFAAWNWTLAHPTGYPLYLIVGGIWQHLLPVGDPAFRLNLFSAFWAALTVGLSYRIFFRIARHRGAALIATMTFAVSPTFWSQATEAEVYSLHTFLIALLTWFALKWQVNWETRFAAAWAFTFGLALAHHRTIILLIPAFAAFFTDAIFLRAYWARLARRGGKLVPPSRSYTLQRDLLYLGLAALPLLLYLYVPLRAEATPYT